MRKNFRRFAVRVAAVPTAVLAGANLAMAQAAPTTAVGLAQSIDLSDAKSAGLIIIGLLVAAGVVLWGGRLVLSKFQPKV